MRNAVTIGAIVLGLAIVAAVFFGTKPTTTTTTDPSAKTPAPTTGPAPSSLPPLPEAKSVATSAPATAPSTSTAPATSPATTTGPAVSAASPNEYKVRAATGAAAQLGGESSKSKLRVELTSYGAAVAKVTLADYRGDALKPDPYVIVPLHLTPESTDTHKQVMFYPFAARSVSVNDTWVDLLACQWERVASDGDSATYRVVIVDKDDMEVLKIERRYALSPNPYELLLEQRIVNSSTAEVKVAWHQAAACELPNDGSSSGDSRSILQGYANINYAGRDKVYTKSAFFAHTSLLDEIVAGKRQFWPNKDIPTPNDLFWVSAINRYFSTTVYSPVPPNVTKTSGVTSLLRDFPGVGLEVYGQKGADADHRVALVMLTTGYHTLAPDPDAKHPLTLDLAVYMGPRKPEVFGTPPYSTLEFSNLVVYELGCAWCTFQPVARGLLWFLRLIEGDVIKIGGVGIGLHDWGLAIIVLVIIVRLLLHPITKRSQIQMAKMSKAMASVQPELEKIKKKFAGDQDSINRETMRLYREKGINPANALGCLPMFLQMPIWVALYAMLYLAIELRHQPAFYGIFQHFGNWAFLADLSSPDNFIRFSEHPIAINLYFFTPHFQSINLLPIILAVVSYYQQKLTVPPPANEQAAQQQKMMKYMVFIVPVVLYNMPSGLTLYTMASTTAGIIDSLVVKRHIKREEEAGTLFQKKPPKPGGLMDRFQKLLDSKMREVDAMRERGGRDKR